MQNLIDQMKEQKETLLKQAEEIFGQAKKIEDAIGILSGGICHVTLNGASHLPHKGHHKNPTKKYGGRTYKNSPINAAPGNKSRIINENLYDFISQHGPANNAVICSHFLKIGIIKRGRRFNLPAYVDKKIFTRDHERNYHLKSPK